MYLQRSEATNCRITLISIISLIISATTVQKESTKSYSWSLITRSTTLWQMPNKERELWEVSMCLFIKYSVKINSSSQINWVSNFHKMILTLCCQKNSIIEVVPTIQYFLQQQKHQTSLLLSEYLSAKYRKAHSITNSLFKTTWIVVLKYLGSTFLWNLLLKVTILFASKIWYLST